MKRVCYSVKIAKCKVLKVFTTKLCNISNSNDGYSSVKERAQNHSEILTNEVLL